MSALVLARSLVSAMSVRAICSVAVLLSLGAESWPVKSRLAPACAVWRATEGRPCAGCLERGDFHRLRKKFGYRLKRLAGGTHNLASRSSPADSVRAIA